MKRVYLLGLLGLSLFFPVLSQADSVQTLKQFLQNTRSYQAEFSQTVTAKSGRKPQSSTGKLALLKPGKFRWEILSPFPQLMVGDGQKVWIYDPDLEQVTVKKMDEALGTTPAALLLGGGELERNFNLSDQGQAEGMAWVEARPKSQESGFESVRLGFTAEGMLKAMALVDSFGQTTLLRFHQPVRNSNLSADLFRFQPPAGVDVIGDAQK